MKRQPKPKKPLKDVDSGEKMFFLRILIFFVRWALIVLPLFIYLFGWLGLILWVLICLTLAIIVEFATDRVGTFAGMLYGGRKGDWSVREQMQGAMDIVQVQKRAGNYEAALTKVEEILAKDPKFPEALFAKAQILHEGFEERSAALRCLQQVLETTAPDEPVHRWAATYRENMSGRKASGAVERPGDASEGGSSCKTSA
jgi:hypothetical protein